MLPTLAGPEIGVASTKAFTCQLMVLARFAVAAARPRGELSDADETKLVHGLVEIPRLMAAALTIERRSRSSRATSLNRKTCSISAAAPAIRWRWKAR